jgi:hypothetical protein
MNANRTATVASRMSQYAAVVYVPSAPSFRNAVALSGSNRFVVFAYLLGMSETMASYGWYLAPALTGAHRPWVTFEMYAQCP